MKFFRHAEDGVSKEYLTSVKRLSEDGTIEARCPACNKLLAVSNRDGKLAGGHSCPRCKVKSEV